MRRYLKEEKSPHSPWQNFVEKTSVVSNFVQANRGLKKLNAECVRGITGGGEGSELACELSERASGAS